MTDSPCPRDGTAVLTGVLMSSSPAVLLPSSTRWDVHLSEWPHPEVLPPAFDVVRVGMAAGKPALDALPVGEVGPVQCCMARRVLLIPVPSGTADRWYSAHSRCHQGRQ
ncbi:hypothetical protein [Streptomyces sp. MZ04]|uniref:hypothetical protein n=1 Tax=Streptomyces sp. MZ04 TaxID=2559236 RepID=UPI00107E6490|nr:hypothetical protein [Streptomyces sp. MZ04]TGB15529.1 hypothetical protein E2651_02620 [Streptomyces sp. MZ04]